MVVRGDVMMVRGCDGCMCVCIYTCIVWALPVLLWLHVVKFEVW